MAHKIITKYVHGDSDYQEDLWEYDTPQQEKAHYWLYELAVKLDVDLETGEAMILSLNGTDLVIPIPA